MRGVQLNRRLVLEARQDSPDGAGGTSQAWAALGVHWADVRLRSGRERTVPAGQASDVDFKITLRAAPVGAASRPKPGQRFVEGMRRYLIEAVSERDVDGRYLICLAREEVQL